MSMFSDQQFSEAELDPLLPEFRRVELKSSERLARLPGYYRFLLNRSQIEKITGE